MSTACGNTSHNTRPIVERLGLEREFDAVILSFEIGVMKPDPAIYREALSRVGDPDPTRSVFVDDQVRYCDGAAALGLQTFLILRQEEAAEARPVDLNGHRPIETLRPLLDPGPYPGSPITTSRIDRYWHAAAAIVAACQISWYPNVRGHGFGRFVASTGAPNE